MNVNTKRITSLYFYNFIKNLLVGQNGSQFSSQGWTRSTWWAGVGVDLLTLQLVLASSTTCTSKYGITQFQI